MENISQWWAVATALGILSIPILLIVSLFRWWRVGRQLKSCRAELDKKTALANKAIETARALLASNRELEGKVSYYDGRFGAVIDIDKEAASLKDSIQGLHLEIAALRQLYAEKKKTYDRLLSEVAIFDERLAFAEMGVYEPHFDFTDSEAYKADILATREKQKQMISDARAVVCTTNWTVDGSVSKGETMIRRGIRLTLRAFNNECEAAISNTRWNNVNAMQKRIVRAQEQIDKLNASNSILVTPEFRDLKLKELHLTHEFREKLRAEREERAEAARLAREEQRLLRDLEQAQEEEDRYARLLAKARAEADSLVGPRLDAFSEQIKVLERDLAAAHAKAERAQAMAERTRSGYVYVISNIGSFGVDVVKIGLTRRLDPIDRVRELGDASVPFAFDTHAIIYSDDAPALERALHAEFEPSRVNLQNYRKEFFRTSLDKVEAALQRVAPDAPFFKDIEAQEYHETLARRRLELSGSLVTEPAFPDAL